MLNFKGAKMYFYYNLANIVYVYLNCTKSTYKLERKCNTILCHVIRYELKLAKLVLQFNS